MNLNSFDKNFIQALLNTTLGVQALFIHSDFQSFEKLDYHLMSSVLNRNHNYADLYQKLRRISQEKTAYYVYEAFHLNYCFMKLWQEDVFLFIGPFLIDELTEIQLHTLRHRYDLSAELLPELKKYYLSLPIVSEKKMIHTINDIAAYLYRSNLDYTVIRIQNYLLPKGLPLLENGQLESKPDKAFSMKLLEERYAIENKLLDAVSLGDKRTAFEMLARFPASHMETSYFNGLSEKKNYLFTLNTLYRKNMERNQIHPYDIDEIHSRFCKEISSCSRISQADKLMIDLTREYCILAREKSGIYYTGAVREAINYINIMIESKLSLGVIAAYLEINASYLSHLFKTETGQTITDYIRQLKMSRAKELLEQSELSVQQISERLGFMDISYFSKLYKKTYGISPSAHRLA